MPIDLSPIPMLDHHCHAFLRRAAPYTAAEYLGVDAGRDRHGAVHVTEARVDAHRFRTGHLTEKDYGRLSHALGTLAEARVFIDDSASVGVLEMRAKARRLKAERGLGLVIIDYLQLISGRARAENGFSRGLIARAYEQLFRSVVDERA